MGRQQAVQPPMTAAAQAPVISRIQSRPLSQQQPQPQPQPQRAAQPACVRKDDDITRMAKPKHELEVIMDPKLRALMPSSMRFKRKFAKKPVRPAKKRKLDIAPEVDDGKEKNKATSTTTNAKLKTSGGAQKEFGAVNADSAYA